jgi:hypothetical protein
VEKKAKKEKEENIKERESLKGGGEQRIFERMNK